MYRCNTHVNTRTIPHWPLNTLTTQNYNLHHDADDRNSTQDTHIQSQHTQHYLSYAHYTLDFHYISYTLNTKHMLHKLYTVDTL